MEVSIEYLLQIIGELYVKIGLLEREAGRLRQLIEKKEE